MSRHNKVYCAVGDADYGCVYIAAQNGKNAKVFAQSTWVMDTIDRYIDLRVTRCWPIKETDYEGELNIAQINELGLAWWACPNCDDDEFEILNSELYKCKKCGYIGKIPYI